MARYRKFRHTWPQRFIFGVNIVVAFGCLAGGGALVYANQQLANRKVVTISSNTKPDVITDNVDVESLPTGDLSAKNFLITGSDQNACADADAPSANEVNNRPKYSGLTDSIMLIRIDPTNNQAAVLSFPRDLYVKIANSDHRNRINTAYRAKDPNRLIDTIRSNFAIEVDHYVSIDFCAFKSIVDAVGGVKVPFLFAARDRRTNFRVAKPGCAKLDGDKALSYVRSRHYFYFDTKKNKWIQDPSSDWGRIARQQDFIRRVLRAALDKGASNPSVANQLLSAALKNVITDDQLSPISLLQLARAMRNVTEDNVHTYTVEGYGKNVGGQSVIEPRLSSDSMEQILAIFQGKAAISEVANQEVTVESSIVSGALPTTTLFATSTTTTTIASKTVGKSSTSRTRVDNKQPSSVATTSTSTIAGPTTPTTAVQQEITQQRFSIVPPNDPTCR